MSAFWEITFKVIQINIIILILLKGIIVCLANPQLYSR